MEIACRYTEWERRSTKICYNNKNYKIKLLTIYLQSSIGNEIVCHATYCFMFFFYLVQGVSFYGTLLTILSIYLTMSFYRILPLKLKV